MKKKPGNTARANVERMLQTPLQASYLLILLAYATITVITPRFGTYDSNAPKFLTLSLLNLCSFLFLIFSNRLNPGRNFSGTFFRNKIGLAYTLFIVLGLVSFAKAINLPESILSFSKYFTVFCAAVIISSLLCVDGRYLRILSIVMVSLLIVDCITVFYNILLYISGLIPGIMEIKSVYSNKNILSSAIFVKIPFAFWLLSFEKGLLKKFGFSALFLAFLATFYMSTRTFYLGLAFLTVSYCIFILLRNRRTMLTHPYKMPVYVFGTLLLAMLIFTLTQRYFYPKTANTYNANVTQRLSTISSGEISASLRLESWKRSAILFKEEPLLGVGTGNWKIRVLEYENPTKDGFMYMVKNHNDFIEITAETGIFGGLAFVSLFGFVFWNFLKAFFSRRASENSYSKLLIPAFGMFCYSFDAFFNFPADRPEIQSLFALFIGMGIAYSPATFNGSKPANPWVTGLFSVITMVFLVCISYMLLLNTRALKLQCIAQADGAQNSLSHPASIFMEGYPSMFNLSSTDEPVAAIKSRYLIHEEMYRDAIKLLLPDRSSPFDSRREYLLAQAYSAIGKTDSALIYAYKAHALKPRFYEPLRFICFELKSTGRKDSVISMLTGYLSLERTNANAWEDLTAIYLESGNYEKALHAIDTAAKHLSGDSLIRAKQKELSMFRRIIPYQQTYTTAMGYYNRQKFPEALKYLDEIISKEHGPAIVFARRAVCYLSVREYQKCIDDVNASITGGYDTPDLLNFRGACYRALGENDAACNDFQNAAGRGNKDAMNNVQRFCKEF
ncbi:MAG: O-antigen ligase family protein [bacterium]